MDHAYLDDAVNVSDEGERGVEADGAQHERKPVGDDGHVAEEVRRLRTHTWGTNETKHASINQPGSPRFHVHSAHVVSIPYLEEAVHLGALEVVEERVAQDEESRGPAVEEGAPPPLVVLPRQLLRLEEFRVVCLLLTGLRREGQ